MIYTVRQKLLRINQEFYSKFATQFATTRYGFQPGWKCIILYFPPRCQVLDLGCGNGRFAHFLDERLQRVRYIGLDGSRALVEIAEESSAQLAHTEAVFRVADLAQPGWEQAYTDSRFDVVVALAVLHHIPGFDARSTFLAAAAACLAPDSALILSNWRFQQNARMRRKIVPWDTVGLDEGDVEPGDYLLDWRAGDETGYRYAHQLDETEVVELASRAGLEVIEQFHADGREGDLSLYSVLKLRHPTMTSK